MVEILWGEEVGGLLVVVDVVFVLGIMGILDVYIVVYGVCLYYFIYYVWVYGLDLILC